MDKVIIKDFEIFANHGVFEEENRLGQKFVISIEMETSLREAGVTDDLTKSIHYGEACLKVEKEFKKQNYDLIETCVEKIAEFLLKEYPTIKNVKVELKKPWAPIGRPLEYAAVSIERGRHIAYIAVGSNMGDKRANVEKAKEIINASEHTKVLRSSSIIETEPFGYTDQDSFLNCAWEVETLLMPEELMDFLLDVEKQLKRERIIKWGPRTLDLDILLYDDIITEGEKAIIPHIGIPERDFVLNPLCELAPYKVHPLLNKRMIELKKELDEKSTV